MKNLTYEEKIKEIAEASATKIEMFDRLQTVINDIMNEDSRLVSVEKNWKCYGTWRVTLFVNEYRFGENLKAALNKIQVITHDEEKNYTIEDLKDDIREAVEEYAHELF